jgi:nucleoside-diphosphate-sugar epimerase
VGHVESMRAPILDCNANCLSTVSLLESCRRSNLEARIVFTSTRQVYGRPQCLPVTEQHPINPLDVNGINKLAAEHYHLLYQRAYGVRSTVLRLTNTYGPRQKISSSRCGFAGYFIYQALRGETIHVYGKGDQRRDFNHVDDVVDAILLAIASERCSGQIYNLGFNPAYSLIEFVDALREFGKFQVETVPFPENARTIEIGDYRGDFSRFQAATGWKPRVDLRQGLARTFEFYRQHAAAYGV